MDFGYVYNLAKSPLLQLLILINMVIKDIVCLLTEVALKLDRNQIDGDSQIMMPLMDLRMVIQFKYNFQFFTNFNFDVSLHLDLIA